MKSRIKIKCPCGVLNEVLAKKPHAIQPTVGSTHCTFCDAQIVYEIRKTKDPRTASVKNISIKATEKLLKRLKQIALDRKLGIEREE